MQIREVGISRILNPTSIDLGEYVINPYKGCSLGCLYCYVKSNKVVKRETRRWGTYVDVRCNAVSQLEKELFIRKPKRVLLGSTTECCQPIEKEYKLTYRIIELLNREGVYYSILTRSPLWVDYIPLLKKGFCEHIYFTVNMFGQRLKAGLEPRSASFKERIAAVNKLAAAKIPVIPYVSPLLPFITDIQSMFQSFETSKMIGFEGLNFNLGNINEVISAISSIYPHKGQMYKDMAANSKAYHNAWDKIKKDIIKEAIAVKKNHQIYVHGLRAYFENRYRQPQSS